MAQQFVPYARARDLLVDLPGARLSVGTLVEWVQQNAAAVKPVEDERKVALRGAPVLHTLFTGSPLYSALRRTATSIHH